MKRHQFIIIILFCILLNGCSATGPVYQPADKPQGDMALVYFYRPSNFIWGGTKASFYIDDKKILALSNNGYSFIYLQEGEYTLKQKLRKRKRILD